MKREVDRRKTSKALRKLRRVAERAEGEGGPGLTDWEKDFVEGVTTRLEKYGSAFRDPHKGRLDDALSSRQAHVARVIDRKSRKPKAGAEDAKPSKLPPALAKKDKAAASAKPGAKPRSSFKSKTGWKPRIRDINDDPARMTDTAPERPPLKVIPGGKAR